MAIPHQFWSYMMTDRTARIKLLSCLLAGYFKCYLKKKRKVNGISPKFYLEKQRHEREEGSAPGRVPDLKQRWEATALTPVPY